MRNIKKGDLIKVVKNPVQTIQGQYDNHIVGLTKKYQKKYGFDMKNSSTHNNQADAFKHAFLSAEGSCFGFKSTGFIGGWSHEIKGFFGGQPMPEFFMDATNNKIGRQIGLEVRNELGFMKRPLSESEREKYYDLIAKKIMKKMNEGELVTNLKDKRIQEQVESYNKLKNYADKLINNKNHLTGYAANIDDDVVNLENRVFHNKEINPAMTDDKNIVNQVLKQYFENGNKMPTEEELKAQVNSGNLIYVDNYTRSDGTKVSGYYRACKK